MRGGSNPRPITWDEVFYQRNVELGLDPWCHECTSHSKRETGYINICRDGFWILHRWVWWRSTGESPEVVMHLCDNPSCINVAHLRAGTHADNIHDRDVKGRCTASGSHRRLFSSNQVREMRDSYIDGASLISLADRFDTNSTSVSRVVKRVYYKDLV